MADDIYTEWVKFWGGLAGLGTAAFTIWDRMLRGRPWIDPHVIAAPDRAALGMMAIDAPLYLRVHNPGRHTIGIGPMRLRRTKVERVFMVADAGRDVHPRRLFPVAAGEYGLFELMWADPEETEDIERPFWIVVAWRPLKALLPRPPLLLRTTLADLIRLQENELQLQQELRRQRT